MRRCVGRPLFHCVVVATLRIRDSKNGESRTTPITRRLAATLEAYTEAAHPAGEDSDYLFYARGVGRPINQATIYVRFRGYLADAGITHFTGGPHPHSLRHGFAVANLRRWAAGGVDLATVLPYLACTWATPTFVAPSTT